MLQDGITGIVQMVCYIGLCFFFAVCREIASDRRELARLGITHILNCAQNKWRGGAEYYEGMNITYQGIEAHDSPTFDMSVNFYPASEFIHKALSQGGEQRFRSCLSPLKIMTSFCVRPALGRYTTAPSEPGFTQNVCVGN